MSARGEVLAALAAHVLAVTKPHPVRVAVDGCSAAGKTTLADELGHLVAESRPVIRVGIDYFKRAVDKRTAYPQGSPESYYLDYWDYPAVREKLLIPLGPGGSRRYRSAVMDIAGRVPAPDIVHTAPDDAILVADGAFLQRPELDRHWDLRIYVHVGFDVVLRRGIARDQAWLDSAAEAERQYRTKYIPGERRYVEEVRPRERAHLVVDNTDFAAPVLTSCAGSRPQDG